MPILTALAFLVSASPGFQQATQFSVDTKAYIAGYRDCLLSKARALEISDAPAEQISAAAIIACKDARDKVRAAIDVDYMLADAPSGQTDSTLRELDRRMTQKIELAVLEKRAARKLKK